MRRILVTGGAGFVGSHLAIALRGHPGGPEVVALDNLRRRGSELSMERLKAAGVAFCHGDIRNPEDIAAAGPFDLLVECSAEPSVLAGYDEAPDYVVNTNLAGTVNCLNAARIHEAAIVFLSTSRVYPVKALNALDRVETESRFEWTDQQAVPGASARGISEQFPLDGSRSLYGATKLCSELLMHEYLDMYGLRGVINRCGVITGPWQMGKIDQGVVVLWAARHLYGGKLSYIGYGGQGKQVRDLLHIDDLVRLVFHQIGHLDDLTGETFNVGGGRTVSVSLLELTAICREITGNVIPIEAVPEPRPADVPVYITDHSRVTQRTGWRPERGVRATVRDVVDWIVAHKSQLEPILG